MNTANFFHEINRAPEVHFTAEAFATATQPVPELDELDLTPYEQFLVSIGQAQKVRYNRSRA